MIKQTKQTNQRLVEFVWFKTHDSSCASFYESIVIKIKCFLKSDEASFDTKCDPCNLNISKLLNIGSCGVTQCP